MPGAVALGTEGLSAHHDQINSSLNSNKNDAKKSNDVLAIVADDLRDVAGFTVETSKLAKDRLTRPVYYGLNGEPQRYDIDGWHSGMKAVLDVEAGAAVANYKFLKALFEAMVTEMRLGASVANRTPTTGLYWLNDSVTPSCVWCSPGLMQQSDIEPGLEYALRESTSRDSPLEKVRVVEKVRAGKWKVEWLDPNPGLVDYVKSQNIVCLWKGRKALLRDEENEQRLGRTVIESWPGEDSPVSGAIDRVLESTGERECWLHKGVLTFRTETLQRIVDRADIEIPEHHSGYRDRRGWNHLPFECALQVARAFAAAEPRTVVTVVELEERQLESQARQPGSSHLLRLLNDHRAIWALVRQWAGHDEALADRDRRIDELTKLLWGLTWELRRDTIDPVRLAGRIERALTGR